MPEHAKPSNTPGAVVSGNGDDLVLDLLVSPRGFAIPPFEALLAYRRPVLLDGGVGQSVTRSLVFTATTEISPRLICISCEAL